MIFNLTVSIVDTKLFVVVGVAAWRDRCANLQFSGLQVIYN